MASRGSRLTATVELFTVVPGLAGGDVPPLVVAELAAGKPLDVASSATTFGPQAGGTIRCRDGLRWSAVRCAYRSQGHPSAARASRGRPSPQTGLTGRSNSLDTRSARVEVTCFGMTLAASSKQVSGVGYADHGRHGVGDVPPPIMPLPHFPPTSAAGRWQVAGVCPYISDSQGACAV